MPSLRSPLLTLACVGLLVSQLSGMHMHADGDGYSGVPSPVHVHRTAPGADEHHVGHADDLQHDRPGDPDHQGDRDISIVELGAGASKLLIASAWLGLGLILMLRRATRVNPPAAVPLPEARSERWRPPLRAPPGEPARRAPHTR